MCSFFSSPQNSTCGYACVLRLPLLSSSVVAFRKHTVFNIHASIENTCPFTKSRQIPAMWDNDRESLYYAHWCCQVAVHQNIKRQIRSMSACSPKKTIHHQQRLMLFDVWQSSSQSRQNSHSAFSSLSNIPYSSCHHQISFTKVTSHDSSLSLSSNHKIATRMCVQSSYVLAVLRGTCKSGLRQVHAWTGEVWFSTELYTSSAMLKRESDSGMLAVSRRHWESGSGCSSATAICFLGTADRAHDVLEFCFRMSIPSKHIN